MSETERPAYARHRQERENRAEERERAERDAAQRDSNTAALNTLVEEIRSYRSEQNQTEPKILTTDRIAAVAAVIAAILSLGSLIAFIFLTLKTDHTAKNVAEWQLTQNRVEQRAFVGLKEIKVTEKTFPNYGPGWYFVPVLENTGATPTRNLVIYPEATELIIPEILPDGKWRFSFYPLFAPGQSGTIETPNKVNADNVWMLVRLESPYDPGTDRKRGKPPLKTVILPHSTIEAGGLGIPREVLTNDTRRGLMWFIRGVIYYNDVFSKGPMHVTKYCYMATFLPEQDAAPEIYPCHHWNCADGECRSDAAEFYKEVAAYRADPVHYNPFK